MTIQNTDLFLVSNGGSKKCEAQNLNGKTGNVLVNRGGVSHRTGVENIPATVLDTDLMLVNRGGESFKATGAEVQTLFPQGPAGGTDVITDVVNRDTTSTLTLDNDRNLDTFTAGDGLQMVDINGNAAAYTPITTAITAATAGTVTDNWTAVSGIQNANGWRSVAYGNNHFVAVAYNGGFPSSMYSSDGINWTGSSSLQGQQWSDLACAPGSLCATVTPWGGQRMYYSTSLGTVWNNSNSGSGASSPSPEWKGICWDASRNQLVAVGSSYSVDGVYTGQTSPNGITWYPAAFDMQGDWVSVASGNGKVVAVSGNGEVMHFGNSGINWDYASPPINSPWTDITYGGGKFVAVASSGNFLMWSTNGTDWSRVQVPSNIGLQSVAYGDGRFVAVGISGASVYSSDGINWTQGATATGYPLYSIVYGKDKFVAVGTSGVVWSSSGGTIKNTVNLALTPTSKDLQYFNPGDKVIQAVNTGTVNSIGTNELVLKDVSGDWTTSVGQAAELDTAISGTGTYSSHRGNMVTVNSSNTEWVDNKNERGEEFYATTQTARLSLAKALTVDDYGVMSAKARIEVATAISGYYPLYRFQKIAELVGNGNTHTHTFDGVTWYMPEGVTYYHGDYTG